METTYYLMNKLNCIDKELIPSIIFFGVKNNNLIINNIVGYDLFKRSFSYSVKIKFIPFLTNYKINDSSIYYKNNKISASEILNINDNNNNKELIYIEIESKNGYNQNIYFFNSQQDENFKENYLNQSTIISDVRDIETVKQNTKSYLNGDKNNNNNNFEMNFNSTQFPLQLKNISQIKNCYDFAEFNINYLYNNYFFKKKDQIKNNLKKRLILNYNNNNTDCFSNYMVLSNFSNHFKINFLSLLENKFPNYDFEIELKEEIKEFLNNKKIEQILINIKTFAIEKVIEIECIKFLDSIFENFSGYIKQIFLELENIIKKINFVFFCDDDLLKKENFEILLKDIKSEYLEYKKKKEVEISNYFKIFYNVQKNNNNNYILQKKMEDFQKIEDFILLSIQNNIEQSLIIIKKHFISIINYLKNELKEDCDLNNNFLKKEIKISKDIFEFENILNSLKLK
ncbi:expressed protein [Dictyostelium purpureum]|uniref:Expressed protein n=1 Tax=Dictyostelium purpureum TaxID=5786 RepID=F0ZQA2_DICPU|nr:uncharacterized protein DICPUDRAFT_92328 [Dictyostelium purpureum]EGC33854.1 expressed protein [Dictyostelium purpureum]|eukprot:XP_003289592.1 expressed protein [Dictyostelium purpureum]